MIKLIHPIAGMLALVTIATFWLSTVFSELSGSYPMIVAVKTAIPWGVLVLVPSLAVVGGSGLAWSKGNRSGLVGAKLRRMPIIAANGVLVLVPSALFLASKASAGEFDSWFYGIQALELTAGAANLALLGMSMRDGLRLSRWRRQSFLKCSTTYLAKLIGREDVAEGTTSFRFERPAGFQFKAGQAVYLTLPPSAPSDSKGRVRTFSLSSPPHARDLTITTRLGDSAFKLALLKMPLGGEVQIEGPYGDMTLDESRPAVFIAGGIGITPFRSMIREALECSRSQRMVLFYSVRTKEEAAFLGELAEIAERHTQFVLVPTVTGAAEASSPLVRGHITAETVTQHRGDIANPVYYVAGPPKMVEDLQMTLIASGVESDDVRPEKFTGY